MSADDIKNTGHVDELGLSDRGIAVQAAGFVESDGGGRMRSPLLRYWGCESPLLPAAPDG